MIIVSFRVVFHDDQFTRTVVVRAVVMGGLESVDLVVATRTRAQNNERICYQSIERVGRDVL